jgi:hypothetical protein
MKVNQKCLAGQFYGSFFHEIVNMKPVKNLLRKKLSKGSCSSLPKCLSLGVKFLGMKMLIIKIVGTCCIVIQFTGLVFPTFFKGF